MEVGWNPNEKDNDSNDDYEYGDDSVVDVVNDDQDACEYNYDNNAVDDDDNDYHYRSDKEAISIIYKSSMRSTCNIAVIHQSRFNRC